MAGMERILGLDVGDKRVGIALSDPGGQYAVSHPTSVRAAGRAEAEILRLIELHQIKRVVVGLPLGVDGARNEQCARVEQFCRRLCKRAVVTIIYVDEYLSSEEAKERLRTTGKNDFSKEELDAAAAAVILQGFLDGSMPQVR